MTNSQRISVKLSEVRQKLNELAGADSLTDEQKAEAAKLTDEYNTLEVQYRAALTAEGDEEARRQSLEGSDDGDGAELRQLAGRARLGRYLAAAVSGRALDGAERELSEALGVGESAGGVRIPYAMLADGAGDVAGEGADGAGDVERRASTTTAALTGGTPQRPILQRLFGRSIMEGLGVRFDSVPAGRPRWPLLTGGVAPAQTAEDAAAPAAVAATFQTQVLQPHRLTGRYTFTVEQAAEVTDLEQALRRDLGDSIRAQQCSQVLSGDGTGANVTGFYNRINAESAGSNEWTYAQYAGLPSMAVDGLHANMESEVSILLGVASYKHSARVYQAGSGEAGIEALRRRGRSVMASSYVPDGSAVQDGNMLHAGGDAMRGDSIAAIWPGLEVIRDIFSGAAEGRVTLTWVVLWDFYAAFRTGAYRRIGVRISA